ncbi:diguanylate cyclase domain-containing protein [Roseateles sp.]|uniref:diguanylate cyclase domain-containing protein n=1 Tax=Roseateles sp. TaxID=1971397 RepID=UPI0039E89A5D
MALLTLMAAAGGRGSGFWVICAIGGCGLAAVIGISAFAYRTARQLASGIDRLRQGVLALAANDTAVRVEPLDGTNPLAGLVRDFNDMADKVGQTRKVLQQQAERATKAACQAEYLARTDPLTELANRSQLTKLMARALSHAALEGHGAGLLFMDIDGFKNINDTLGHDIGDAVLREIADRLRTHLDAETPVARLGGDEFVILVPQCNATPWLRNIAHQVHTALAEPFRVGGQDLHVTCSIGISTFPRDGTEERALMKSADIALYRAKNAGRDGFAFFSTEPSAIDAGPACAATTAH